MSCFCVIPSSAACFASAIADSSAILTFTSTVRRSLLAIAGGSARPAPVATWRNAAVVALGAFAMLFNGLAAIGYRTLQLAVWSYCLLQGNAPAACNSAVSALISSERHIHKAERVVDVAILDADPNATAHRWATTVRKGRRFRQLRSAWPICCRRSARSMLR
jgi:hypothetical protein